MPRPKITDKSTPSGFIRSMPNASPAEILAAAKKAGLKFSPSLIYMVRRGASTRPARGRGSSKTKGARRGAATTLARPEETATRRKVAAPPGRRAVAESRGASSSAESELRRLILDVGVARAEAILHEVKTKLERMLRGD